MAPPRHNDLFMSIPDLEVSTRAASAAVSIAIVAIRGVSLEGTVAALSRQAYEVESISVIGADAAQTAFAEANGMTSFGSMAALAAGTGPEIEMVWILHGDSEPRPDALAALVFESQRNDASLVGSKILDAAIRDRLESVGGATDVFGEPYLGLDEDEVDLEQYDVVRDVAHVSGVSLLIRRDLLRGLQGTDQKIPPGAAGMDLSQRARLAGARVMVVPSSEVFHSRDCTHDVAGWREQAGRMRSMFKVYRLLTLLWVVPVGFVVAMIDGVARLLLRQFRPLADYLRALIWNIAMLGSTWSARRVLKSVRVTSDEELFRHQVGGSIRLRNLSSDFGERLGWVIDREPGVLSEDEVEDDSGAAALVVLVMVISVVAIASRGLWFGTAPVGGFSLPLGDNPWQVVRGFAGGWNTTGLGSPEPVPPSVAGLSLLQAVLGGWQGARNVAVAASLIAAVVGTGRLLERMGISGPSRHLAGLLVVVGPFVQMQGEAGQWTGLLALGPLVWVIVWALRPEGSMLGWTGRLVLATVAGVVGTWWFPVMAVTAILVGAAVAKARWSRTAVAVAVVGLVGTLAASPYLLAVDPTVLFEGGRALWPPPWLIYAGAGTLVLGLLSAADRAWRIVAWGGILSLSGVIVAAVAGLGLEAQNAGLVFASLGLGLVAGALIALDDDSVGLRKSIQVVVSFAVVGVVMMSLPAAVGGSLGLEDDGWGERLEFVGALSSNPSSERVLLVGPAGSLPGEVRAAGFYEFRLVNGPLFGFDQAHLPEERIGDRAMREMLDVVAGGGSLRPGAELAPFAIRWIVVVGDSGFSRGFNTQLDVREVSVSPGVRVFENTVASARVESGSADWMYEGDTLTGPPVESIRLADNFDGGWAADRDGWANRIPASSGVLQYRPDPLRLGLALAIPAAMALAAGAVWLGRKKP